MLKPKHQRLIFVAFSVVFLCAAVLLTLEAFKKNIVYFYTPSELVNVNPISIVRVGGLVKAGSARKEGEKIIFTITDGKHEVQVEYTGILPNLFREGQGVIAEGLYDGYENGVLTATTILAKHDEKYMPKEVVESLKKSGHWEGQYAR